MTEQSEHGGAALVFTVLALVLAPAVYASTHPHPMTRHGWIAYGTHAAGAAQIKLPKHA